MARSQSSNERYQIVDSRRSRVRANWKLRAVRKPVNELFGLIPTRNTSPSAIIPASVHLAATHETSHQWRDDGLLLFFYIIILQDLKSNSIFSLSLSLSLFFSFS